METRMKIVAALSNRATFVRTKLLFDEMHKQFDLTLLLTSSLLEEEYARVYSEAHDLYNCVDIPMGIYSGSLLSMAETTGVLSKNFCSELVKINPNIAMVIADRFEQLPFGMVATYLNIPLIHIQGFEISGNIDDKVRNALSALADLHLVSHHPAFMRAKTKGVENVHNTGCPSIDMIKKYKSNIVGNYIIMMFHPHTKEYGSELEQISSVLFDVKRYCAVKGKKLMAFGPNNDAGHKKIVQCLGIDFIHNMEGEKFYRLLASAEMIVGNSSCGIREASFFGTPSVTIGDRQKGRVAGDNVIRCGFDNIYEAMEEASKLDRKPSLMFGDGNSVDRMINIIRRFSNGKSQEAKS